MKKYFCIYLALAICMIFQSESYAEPNYEKLNRFLDDFHRMNLGDWVPDYALIAKEFGDLAQFKIGSVSSPKKLIRAYERFIAMVVRYYGKPYIKDDVFEQTFKMLDRSEFDKRLIQSTEQTINDVDKSWILSPMKGFLVSKFKKKIQNTNLPRTDAPPKSFIDDDYEKAVEKINNFLDSFHLENLADSVSHPKTAHATFNKHLSTVQESFNVIFSEDEESLSKTTALYTLKIDICRAYIRFIPIIMQYYCDELLTGEIFEEAFSLLKKIDSFNSYPQTTELVEATKLMIDTMNSIGGTGTIISSVRGLLTNSFKKKLK